MQATLTADDIRHLAFTAVLYGVPLAFAARTAATILLRFVGLSHPDHYRRWPRVPWRALWVPVIRFKEWREEVFRMGRKATAGWVGTPAMLSMLYRPGTVLLGRAYGWGAGWLMPVGMKCSRHLFLIAMTGAGKTVFLTTLVGLWRGSVFLIDPKNQVTQILRRLSKKMWQVIDPFRLGGTASAVWNWFDEVHAAMEREGPQAAVRMAIKCGESLVITPPGDRSPFFPNSARGFAVSLLLFILRYCPREKQNLITFRGLLNRGLDGETNDKQEAFEFLLYTMSLCDDFGGVIANGAAALKNAGPETQGNILATLREQSKWLDLPELRPVLTGQSTVLTPDLKTRDDLILSFVAPVGAIREELAPFARLLTNTIAHTFETLQTRKRRPCLFAIDELPAQGYNRTLEQIAPVARSYGLQLLGIAQDTGNLRAAYPQTWESFIGNADAVWWMGSNHQETIAYLEKILGTTTHREQVEGAKNPIERERPLMYAEQIRRFLNPARGRVIVTRAGKRPLRLKIATYYGELPVTAYEPDPEHREAMLRRVARFLIGIAQERRSGGQP